MVSQEQQYLKEITPAGLSFLNNLMITIKSLRILDLGLPYWFIVKEK